MACSSCGTGGGCSTGGGCGKSGGCSSGGCNKMNSFDWLSNMETLSHPKFNIVEVRFKGGRKDFYKNEHSIEMYTGDAVVVEVQGGHHIGYISLQGELVRLQMRKKSINNDEGIKQIFRIASSKDIEKFENARNREASTLFRARNIINELKLDMKLTDVEYQADNTKATFYYSAEDRVDFRELIKFLAGEFKVRIEMKQISLRQEAGRLGGIGSCGRELCCSTWLSDFKNVSTSAARYQNLSLNPAKLSGQCGRLKCCLNYELDTYMNALKGIPEVEVPLKTLHGNAYLQKTDIFRKIMWFGYKEESNWYQLSVERVNAILELNKKGITPATLDANEEEVKNDDQVIKEKIELSRFDDKFSKSQTSRKKKKKRSDETLQSRDTNVQKNLPSTNIGGIDLPNAQPKPNTEKKSDSTKRNFHKKRDDRKFPPRGDSPNPANTDKTEDPK